MKCCGRKNDGEHEHERGSRASNQEFLRHMDSRMTICTEAREDLTTGGGPSPGFATGYMQPQRPKPPVAGFKIHMEKQQHIIEELYYQAQADGFRPGLWKNYDATEFQTIRINIARATTGKIHLMAHRKSGFIGVMKILPYKKGAEARVEMNILSNVRDCPFILRIIDGFQSDAFYLFLEYAPFRTVDHLTQAVRGLGSDNSRLYSLEVACAIDFLHERNIIHRDIKPENILVLISGHVALGDLGEALMMEGPTVTNRICGTYVTRPPEVWNAEKYSFPVDIWEFGMTLYNMISNTWPIAHANKETQIINVNKGKISFSNVFNKNACDLITKVLTVDPDQRLNPKQIIQHPYYEDLAEPYAPPFSPNELAQMYNFGDEEDLIKDLVSQLYST